MKKKSSAGSYWYLSVLTVAVILAAWFIATGTESVSPLFVPSPKSVLNSFVTTWTDGYKGSTLLQHLGTSMKRLVIAYLLCVVTAVPIVTESSAAATFCALTVSAPAAKTTVSNAAILVFFIFFSSSINFFLSSELHVSL